MKFLMLANHLIMLAGGIDADKKPLSGSERWGVTLVGLGVVIAALAILVLVITVFGKIFESANANQKAREEAAKEQKKPKTSPPAPAKTASAKTAPAKPAVPAPAPVQAAETDDDEVIAVISAVVAMMSEADGKVYKVKSVKPISGNGFSGRSAWAMDGRRQNVNHTF